VKPPPYGKEFKRVVSSLTHALFKRWGFWRFNLRDTAQKTIDKGYWKMQEKLTELIYCTSLFWWEQQWFRYRPVYKGGHIQRHNAADFASRSHKEKFVLCSGSGLQRFEEMLGGRGQFLEVVPKERVDFESQFGSIWVLWTNLLFGIF